MLGALEKCPHEVEPVPGNEDWGRCKRCGADDFPMTDAAAYGPTDCSTFHDTGMVPADVEGMTATSKDGTTYVLNGAFASKPCPDCRHEFAALGITL